MRHILITGASGGIAQAMIPLLKDDFLILLGRDAQKIEELYASHSKKAIYEIDISKAADLAALVKKIYQDYGKIDVLVNNAGYAIYGDFENFSEDQVRAMFDVNLFALMALCRLVGKEMKAAKAGHIINIVSMSGKIASAKSSIYSATKLRPWAFPIPSAWSWRPIMWGSPLSIQAQWPQVFLTWRTQMAATKRVFRPF